MKSFLPIVLLAVTCWSSNATVTISLTASTLRTGATPPETMTSGLVFLAADRSGNGFGGPMAGSFVTGDDFILFYGGLAAAGTFIGGIESLPVDPIPSGNLSVGDPLRLYWFPTVTVADFENPFFNLDAGTSYGSYHGGNGADGSAPWFIPADGSVVSLIFSTPTIANPLGAGDASSIVPVPEASNLIFGGLALGLVAFRLVPQLRRKLANR